MPPWHRQAQKAFINQYSSTNIKQLGMKKKTYQMPSTKTFILRQQNSLLAGSGDQNATRDNEEYGPAITDDWG